MAPARLHGRDERRAARRVGQPRLRADRHGDPGVDARPALRLQAAPGRGRRRRARRPRPGPRPRLRDGEPPAAGQHAHGGHRDRCAAGAAPSGRRGIALRRGPHAGPRRGPDHRHGGHGPAGRAAGGSGHARRDDRRRPRRGRCRRFTLPAAARLRAGAGRALLGVRPAVRRGPRRQAPRRGRGARRTRLPPGELAEPRARGVGRRVRAAEHAHEHGRAPRWSRPRGGRLGRRAGPGHGEAVPGAGARAAGAGRRARPDAHARRVHVLHGGPQHATSSCTRTTRW